MSRITPSQLLDRAGIAASQDKLGAALLNAALHSLKKYGPPENAPAETLETITNQLLTAAGPTLGRMALDHALGAAARVITNAEWNGDAGKNLQTVYRAATTNQAAGDTFLAGLRGFLLPRYGAYSFDAMVDPKHRLDSECGYPAYITPSMYRFMYDRDDTSRRVNDIYPDESWSAEPEIYESDKEGVVTDFERDYNALSEDFHLPQFMYRADKLCGVGRFGGLLLGLGDGKDLDQPVDEVELLAGKRRAVAAKRRELIFVRAFDEYLAQVGQVNTDKGSPRCGLPEYYNLSFNDLDMGGVFTGTSSLKKVHWTRVVHVADNLETSLWDGTPRLQPVFNRLLDLRKIKGGSGEMFYKGGFPGISFEIDPRLVEDDPEFDKDAFNEEVHAYATGLRRYMRLVGVKANSLAPNVADPRGHVMVQLQAIACHSGVPLRVFLGSEEGRVASDQDRLTWNQRIRRRLRMFVGPSVVRNLADRLIAVGCVAAPGSRNWYKAEWPDLNTPTDSDKADLGLKWTQAISQYVASGAIHMIPPKEYLTMVLGMKPSDALRIVNDAEAKGGWAKLLKVDPSEGTGMNGIRKSIVKPGTQTGTVRSRPKQQSKSTKQANAMKS